MSVKMPFGKPVTKPVTNTPAKPAAQPTFAGKKPDAKHTDAPKHAPLQGAKSHAHGQKFDRIG